MSSKVSHSRIDTENLATSKDSATDSPSHDRDGTPRGPKRQFLACLRCRKRKVKCPGGQPCSKCNRTGHDCVYDGARKVFVSEKYLHELERSAPEPAIVAGTEVGGDRFTSIQSDHSNEEDVANPLTGNTFNSTTDSFGGHHFVGTSSTWGFAWRIRRLLSTLPLNSSVENQVNEVDDIAYSRTGAALPARIQDARQLPRETSERYLSNYMYHIAPLWHFIDPSRFSAEAQTPVETLPSYSGVLWQAQFNLIMSLGKLLEQGKKLERSPGESHFFFGLSLIESLNESQAIAQEPILLAQNFCLISFYFDAINMRNDAYINIGKATRIAFTQGLHRNTSATPSTTAEQESRVRFWWSLYSLDMTLSSLMGAPVPVHEDEITTRDPLPHASLPAPEPLMQLVRMARLTGVVLADIYGSRSRDRFHFVRSMRKVLNGAAETIKTMPIKHQLNLDEEWHVSRTSATLHLFAYQIIIVAVRPVLFYLVEQKVERIATQGPFPSLTPPSNGFRHLLKKLMEAAVVSMRILSSLRFQSQLQTYLTFDVTAAFSSAVIISLTMFISSQPMEEVSHIQEALLLLEDLGTQGNISAQKRSYELQCLHRDLNIALQSNPSDAQALPNAHISSDVPGYQQTSSNESPVQAMHDVSILSSTANFSIGGTWENGSASSFFGDENIPEDFEAIFSQMAEYPEIIPFQI